MNNFPSILTPDFGLLFWMSLAFLVVFCVLAKFGFPAIIKMVEGRKQYIDDSLRKAHEASERLDNIKQEGDAILQEAREKQAQVINEAAVTRDTMIEKAQAKAHEESARIISDAKAQIENDKQNAVRDIRAQVAELSIQIAENILREKLSSNDMQMEMIDRLLDEVSKSENKD
ncbi:F0F1 ATP synthase subunit B [Hoylesella oralis]|uniref:F0F1 ATP synthase subunit B n=1 Tax=Hoylesella oralis TaxID=28134 RepID=UPI0028E95BF2|nr:F0F1 ATP synthase subunit B [Hoylesella oralis]